MRRLTLPLCVALALFSILAVWMFTSADGALSAAGPVRAHEQAAAAAARPGDATNSQADEALPARSAAAAPSTDEALEMSAQALGREVVPVTGASERRVGDAQVWWCAEPEGAPPAGHISTFKRLRECMLDEYLASSARPLAPDEEGRFFLDADARKGTLVARAPGLFGTLGVSHGGTLALRVALEPDHALQVRVVDTEGAPVAGVCVALRQFYSGAHFNDHGRARTNADGVAQLPHYRALIAGDWDFTAQYALSIAEPLSPTVNHFFEVAQPPQGRIDLVLPPCGSVELKLPPDAEWREVGLEALGAAPEQDRDWPSFADGWRRPADGVVLFPFVGLQLELVPATRSDRLQSQHPQSRLRGPRTAGEKIVVQLGAQTGLVRIRGRLLDADGAVLGAHQISVRCSGRRVEEDEDSQLGDASSSSDSTGEFRLEFAHRDVVELELELEVRANEFLVIGAARRTNIARRGAELDLGDVRLERWDAIASGLVVDALGNPAPDALVEVYEASERRDRSGAVHVNWQQLYSSRARANASGAFELRAPQRPARIALVANSDTGATATLECRGGASGLQLVLSQAGELVGRIVTAPDTRLDYLELRVTCVEPTRPHITGPEQFHPFVDTNGEFVLRGLPEGRYVVEVHRQGFDEALATLEDVHVRVDGPADPRLNPLVLTERPELVEVRLVDARDRPVSDATLVRVEQTPDGPELEHVGFPSSRMLVDRSMPPLWILADGFAAREFDPATVGDTLRLTRAPLLRVEFSPGCEVPRDGVNTWIGVTPLDHPSALSDWLATRLSPAAHGAQTQVAFLGRVQLELWLEGNGSASVPLEIVGGGTLVDTSLAQTATLKFEPEALERALQEVGQRQ